MKLFSFLLNLLTATFLLTPSAFLMAKLNHTAKALSLGAPPKYPDNFKHFDYVNPNAPKGGIVVLSAIGSYDTLNNFTLKGQAAAGLNLLYDQLCVASEDEVLAYYGHLASKITLKTKSAALTFEIHPKARWHDGKPVTPADVIHTFKLLREKGLPFYRYYYKDIKKITQRSARAVEFQFDRNKINNELYLIVCQVPILPKHYWEEKYFTKTTLTPPLGSGPYRIKTVKAGRSITYERVKNYWAEQLPTARGRNNFAQYRYEYYRNRTPEREALKAGQLSFFRENTAKEWATAYNIPAVKQNRLLKVEWKDNNPQGTQGFFFNIRRKKFSDPKVRAALAYAFDFEWSNKVLFFNAYERSRSYFNNSVFSAALTLPDREELAILTPYKAQLPEEVFTKLYAPPKTDGSGNLRENLRKAKRALAAAGWKVTAGVLTHEPSGERMEFEILIVLPAFEKIIAPFVQHLRRLGIKARIVLLNPTQYQERLQKFDFDLVVGSFGQSDSPGNEQREFWGSAAADREGSRNIVGIKEPVVDALIEKVISAPDRQALITRVRALDRVLLWKHYMIPHWFNRNYRLLYWDIFGQPKVRPKFSIGFDTWWIDESRARKIKF